jgi:two-component system, cell cycle sensor histidine kinase and response regulator CckA
MDGVAEQRRSRQPDSGRDRDGADTSVPYGLGVGRDSLNRLARLCAELAGADACVIRVDAGGDHSWGRHGLDPWSAQAWLFRDLDRPALAAAPLRAAGLVSSARVLLRLNGVVTGVIALAARAEREWTAAETERVVGATAPLVTELLYPPQPRGAGGVRSVGPITEQLRPYQAMIDAVPDMVWMIDADARIVACNEALVRFLGRTRSEVLGRPDEHLLPPGLPRGTRPEDLRALREGRTVVSEGTAVGPDGAGQIMRLSQAPFHDDDGRITGAVVVSRPITEERSLEAQLEHAQKMEAVGRLAGGVAHDFNNLLTAIQGHTVMALYDLEEDAPARHHLLEVERAADRAETLTRQLLSFSRKETLEAVPLDLNGLISDLRELLLRLIGADVAVDLRLAGALPIVEADPGRVEQVLMNLVVNARDAMPHGGRLAIATSREVVTGGAEAGGPDLTPGVYARIAVIDTGTGIPDDVLPRIFEPFFTTKGQGQGTGLGLATALGIATRSGGRLTVQTEPGVGTEFSLWLPAAAAHRPTPRAGRERVFAPSGAAPSTVLVAEDDEAVRTLMAKVLSGAGHQVLTAASGGEALSRALDHQGPLDLVIADVVMPDMGGLELGRHMQAALPGVPVLMMTGYTWEEVSGSLPEPDFGFLAKPFTPRQLLDSVSSLLEAAPHHEA